MNPESYANWVQNWTNEHVDHTVDIMTEQLAERVFSTREDVESFEDEIALEEDCVFDAGLRARFANEDQEQQKGFCDDITLPKGFAFLEMKDAERR